MKSLDSVAIYQLIGKLRKMGASCTKCWFWSCLDRNNAGSGWYLHVVVLQASLPCTQNWIYHLQKSFIPFEFLVLVNVSDIVLTSQGRLLFVNCVSSPHISSSGRQIFLIAIYLLCSKLLGLVWTFNCHGLPWSEWLLFYPCSFWSYVSGSWVCTASVVSLLLCFMAFLFNIFPFCFGLAFLC